MYIFAQDVISYRLLTTETNLKVSFIFRCLFTTSSVKLFLVNEQLFVYNRVDVFFRKKEKKNTKPLTFWKWKRILKENHILKMKACFGEMWKVINHFFLKKTAISKTFKYIYFCSRFVAWRENGAKHDLHS